MIRMDGRHWIDVFSLNGRAGLFYMCNFNSIGKKEKKKGMWLVFSTIIVNNWDNEYINGFI